MRTLFTGCRPLLLVGLGLLIGCPDNDGNEGQAGCVEPDAILTASGEITGFVRCADGSINRVVVSDFDLAPYEQELIENPDSCGWGEDHCATHEDCDPETHSFCVHDQDGDYTSCGCRTPCSSDEECGEGRACFPPELELDWASYPRCHEKQCSTNDDCESGECGVSFFWDEIVVMELFCRSQADDCRVDSDCEHGGCELGRCP